VKSNLSVPTFWSLLFRTLCVVAICTAPAVALGRRGSTASAQQNKSSLLERTHFDWDHSGTPTTFSLISNQTSSRDGEATRLIISRTGKQSWSLTNRDDVWAPLSGTELSRLQKQNLVPTSKRLLFVSATSTRDAHVYLILKGAVSGCCVGSLTILTPGDDGEPKVVFHASNHLIAAITPTDDGNALQIIGQSSDSEARALKNAQSYDPYRVYLLQGDQGAKLDLNLSKAYTLSHYCQWHGPKYDERFVAVGPPTGSDHCRVITDQAFGLFRQKHPQLFPEP
jgi:hypothetical protein